MSDTETKEAPKKKSKLPMIVGVVAILGGGGFFMMKSKGGEKTEKPKTEMGTGDASLMEMEEKLYNLADGVTYLRTTLAFQLKKGFEAEHLTKDVNGAIDDAVFMVMSTKRPTDFIGVPKIKLLKKQIAAAVNGALHQMEESKEKEKDKGKDSEESKEKDSEKGHEKESKEDTPPKIEHPDWDSQDGPVLKVYIRALAMQ